MVDMEEDLQNNHQSEITFLDDISSSEINDARTASANNNNEASSLHRCWQCDICNVASFDNIKEAIEHEKKCNVLKNDRLTRISEWYCDVCKVACFTNFDDAVEHEKNCKLIVTDCIISDAVAVNDMMNDHLVVSPADNSIKNNNDCTSLSLSIESNHCFDNNEEEVLSIWKCDYCKIAIFHSFEEAVEHEGQCCKRIIFPTTDNAVVMESVGVPETSTRTKTDNVDASLKHKTMKDDVSGSCTRMEENSRDDGEVVDICESQSGDSDDVMIVESSNESTGTAISDIYETLTNKNSRRSSRLREVNTFSTAPILSSEQQKITRKKSRSNDKNDSTKNDCKKANSISITTTKEKKTRLIASIFSSNGGAGCAPPEMIISKELLREQQIVEFQVKRRQKEAQERERQQKRQRIFLERQQQTQKIEDNFTEQKLFQSLSNSKIVDVKINKMQSLNTKKNCNRYVAPRFPVPSHVIGGSIESNTAYKAFAAYDAGNSTVQENQYSLTVPDENDSSSHFDGHLKLSDFTTGNSSCLYNDVCRDLEYFNDNSMLLDNVLQTFLIPPSSQFSSTTTTRDWVHNYCTIRDIENDICGYSLCNAAKDLKHFIERWISEREQANSRMAAKQKAFGDKHKPKHNKKNSRQLVKAAKRSYQAKDDDLWTDDDSDDEISNRLQCLHLITGPVGCGKTAIVHAVATSMDCVVLEINTSHDRSGVGLKKLLLEAIQSHSSLELLNKNKARETNNSWFSSINNSTRVLEDSDSEVDVKKPSTSITVVLIDEIDLIFEDGADIGFWVALRELCQKSKCPIILTANTYPIKLDSFPFRFNHSRIIHPQPSEWVPKIQMILEKESFSFTSDYDESFISNMLKLIVELAGCDIRRLIHHLEMTILQPTKLLPLKQVLLRNLECFDKVNNDLECFRPIVRKLDPHGINTSVASVVTVKGSNFMKIASTDQVCNIGYSVSVHFGDVICSNARILDDSTIFAAWSPSCDMSFLSRNQHCKRSSSILYKQVNVSGCGKRNKLGIVSTSSGLIECTELPDGSSLIRFLNPSNLEYHVPGYTVIESCSATTNIHSDDDEEFEFDDATPFRESKVTTVPASVTPPPNHKEIDSIDTILKEGIDKWCQKNRIQVVSNEHASGCVSKQDLCDIEETSRVCDNISDAVLFEDVGFIGLPHLSGSCRGFGFDFTEEFPKRCNENSKP